MKFSIDDKGDTTTTTTEGVFTLGPTTLKGKVTTHSSTPGTADTICSST